MLSRNFTGNKVLPAPYEDVEAQSSSGLLIVHPGELAEEGSRDKTQVAPPVHQQPTSDHAPLASDVFTYPPASPRPASLPARPTLLSATSNLASEEGNGLGAKLPGASRVPKARAQRFFPSATAVDKVSKPGQL